MAQSRKHSLCKGEDMNSGPQNPHKKLSVMEHTCNPRKAGWGTETGSNLVTHGLVSLMCLPKFQANARPKVLKDQHLRLFCYLSMSAACVCSPPPTHIKQTLVTQCFTVLWVRAWSRLTTVANLCFKQFRLNSVRFLVYRLVCGTVVSLTRLIAG